MDKTMGKGFSILTTSLKELVNANVPVAKNFSDFEQDDELVSESIMGVVADPEKKIWAERDVYLFILYSLHRLNDQQKIIFLTLISKEYGGFHFTEADMAKIFGISRKTYIDRIKRLRIKLANFYYRYYGEDKYKDKYKQRLQEK